MSRLELSISVCETIQDEHEVEEDTVDCRVVKERKCKTREDGEEWCFTVPRTECTKETGKSIRRAKPRTECREGIRIVTEKGSKRRQIAEFCCHP